MKHSRDKKILYWLILVLVAYGFTELSAAIALSIGAHFQIAYWPISSRALFDTDKKAIETLINDSGDGAKDYLIYDQELGWSIRPRATSASGLYHSNKQGLRADREYKFSPAKEKIRISAYGDSFTHSDEVPNAQTWETDLEKLDDRLEVLNFGVGGYGPDQAYLRYLKEHGLFKSNIVLIGFMSENINRVVNVFRAFYTPQSGTPLSKPRYLINPNGDLMLRPNPLASVADYKELLRDPERLLSHMAEMDYWFNVMPHVSDMDALPSVRLFKTAHFWFQRTLAPWSIIRPDGTYRARSEALALTEKILEKNYRDVLSNGETPVIVLFPSHRDILRFRKNGKKRYQLLLDYFGERKLRTLDLLDGFQRKKGQYHEGGILSHYSSSENEIVAQTVLEYLKTQGLLTQSDKNSVSEANGYR